MKWMVAGALPLVMLAAGCAAAIAADGGENAVNVRTAMVDGVNPAALAIWDVGNNAIDDEGQPDASNLDADTLARLKDAARMLLVYSHRLSQAEVIQAAGPDLVGGKLPEGVASREQIQAAIDADPQGFRALAAEMGAQADGLVAAIDDGDKAAVAELLGGFDGACQSCHERYWYVHVNAFPDQAAR